MNQFDALESIFFSLQSAERHRMNALEALSRNMEFGHRPDDGNALYFARQSGLDFENAIIQATELAAQLKPIATGHRGSKVFDRAVGGK